MKKLIGLIVVCAFSLNVMAQEDQHDKAQKQQEPVVKYCATLKDGKIMMTEGTRNITADVTLANGTKIKADGKVIKNDGTEITLKNGECVDGSGNVMNSKNPDELIEEKYKKMPPK